MISREDITEDKLDAVYEASAKGIIKKTNGKINPQKHKGENGIQKTRIDPYNETKRSGKPSDKQRKAYEKQYKNKILAQDIQTRRINKGIKKLKTIQTSKRENKNNAAEEINKRKTRVSLR